MSLLVLYCVVNTLPLIAIAALFVVMGKRAEGILRPAGDWLFAHRPVIVGPLTATIGIGVLAFGIVQLASTSACTGCLTIAGRTAFQGHVAALREIVGTADPEHALA